MSIKTILGLIVGCTVGFGTVGGLLGYALGGYAPGYYRSVFSNGDDPGFQPVQVGTGLGITQGVGTGLVIGLVVVVMLAISGVPRKKDKPGRGTESLDDPEFARSTPMRRSYWGNLLIVAVLTLPLVTGAIGMVIGLLIYTVHTFQDRKDATLARIRPILEEKPYLDIEADANGTRIFGICWPEMLCVQIVGHSIKYNHVSTC
jgi:hypothetical protein